MPMTEAEILRLIKESLPDAVVELEDLRGDGDHFKAYVESRAFVGKTLVQQHQMVYAALQGRVGGVLRALVLSTAIPPQKT
jgi:stress-induced morphogen